MHLHHHVTLRYWMFSCTCTITSCYVIGRSLALAPSRHATLLDVLLHLHHHVTLRYWKISCTCTITSCYATGRSLALTPSRHTTLLEDFLHLHHHLYYITGRFLALAPSPLLHYWTFSCTFTSRHAMLVGVFLHLHHHVMLLGLLSVMKSQADQYKGFKDHTLEWRLVELDLPWQWRCNNLHNLWQMECLRSCGTCGNVVTEGVKSCRTKKRGASNDNVALFLACFQQNRKFTMPVFL